jgi:hypothetical protein
VNFREKTVRIFSPLGFFLTMLFWIALKMAYSFRDEFPALGLLCKWDCGWYESIARQGYLSPIPPLFQNSEASNVAFFPAYPFISRAIGNLLQIPYTSALPLTSILCAILVSISVARLLREETRLSRFVRYAILVAYPAAFYLFVSYSESLYLAAMLGGTSLLLFDRKPGKLGFLVLAVAGIILGGTRLTGFVIPSLLLAAEALLFFRNRRDAEPSSAFFLGGAIAGSGAFFAYCAFRFGYWNLYFWQVSLGWYKEFSPLKALQLLFEPKYGPSLNYDCLQTQSRSLSWMVIATLAGVSVYAGIRAVLSARQAYLKNDRGLLLRCALIIGAITHFFIVVCGDVGPWDLWGNGLRYPMPTVFLLTLAWRDEWTPAIIREKRILKWVALGVLAVVLVWLFTHEVGYLGRFIRNEWVS